MPQLSNVSAKTLEEKKKQIFNSMNPYTFSKLKGKEFVRELLVQKVSNDAGLVNFER